MEIPDAVDIAIVGGGATGLGAAVDAAARGHSVLLIEQSDFAKGTSSRSTKLMHGGVRYLKQGNLPLVFEALRERERLYQNAKGLVQPLAFVIPGYQPWDLPFYGLGLTFYDLLAGPTNAHRSRMLSRNAVAQRLPTLRTEKLTGGVLYYDGQFDDARLALALVRTAEAHGAVVRNYLRCDGFLKRGSQVVGIRATDQHTGETASVQARCVLNATGVFVDALRQIDKPRATPLLRLSQGTHLVLPAEFLPGTTALMIPRTADNRVLFALPWRGAVLLGTTDTAVPEATLEPRPLPEEVDFLLQHAARYLTRAPGAAEVRSAFSGLRPLVQQASASSTAALSREHLIETAETGLVTITGGKWTTYRKMAEDVIDHIERHAGLASRPCPTRDLHLTLPDPPAGLEVGEAVRWHVRHTQVRTVEDYLARRTRGLLLDARASAAAADTVAAVLADALGWSAAQQQRQAADYRALAQGYCL